MVLGGGFLGSRIAHQLSQSGRDVLVLTKSEPRGHAASLLDGCEIVVGDVRDVTDLATMTDGASHVIYALGALHPFASNFDPIADVSTALVPLLSVLEQLSQNAGLTFTFLSSGGTVYGDATQTPTTEEAPTEPLSSYGIMKLAGEKYTMMHHRLGRMQPRILRIGNVYGPGQSAYRGQGVIAAFLDCAETGKPLRVFGDGSITRDYIYVDDMADAVVRLLDAPPEPRVLNVGTGVGTSVRQVLDVVRTVSGRSTTVEYLSARATDVQSSVLDTRRIRELIPFNPRSLEDGVRDTCRARTRQEGARDAGLPEGSPPVLIPSTD